MAKKKSRIVWELRVAVALVIASVALYIFHFTVFRDLRHIWFWSFTSLAFLPLSVLFVTVFINRLLAVRDRALRLEKLNMLIGVFFSSVGTDLLAHFADWDPDTSYLRRSFGSPQAWSGFDPRKASRMLNQHSYDVSPTREGLQDLRSFLIGRTDFLLRLLENPNLHEHESFTDLLRAVFHLAEELACRRDIAGIPDSDLNHLAGDVKRSYTLLVREWVIYLAYLKVSFPYLFSLAVRTNPLDRTASPIVE